VDLEALKDYRNWIHQTAAEVLRSVKSKGGWDIVFPRSKPFPRWASKVRNFFNETPLTLKRLNEAQSKKWRAKEHKYDGQIKEYLALSPHVYEDGSGHHWFQMSAAAAIYHYGEQPEHPTADAIGVTAKTGVVLTAQNYVPVFKLVSPDGTGGSRECIIDNPKVLPVWAQGLLTRNVGKSSIGEVDEWVNVHGRIVDDPVLQGSYNYSETIARGFDAHKLRDMDPHNAHHMFYLNPGSRYSSLTMRRFPSQDNYGRPLADNA
jgi:hypothetical protein